MDLVRGAKTRKYDFCDFVIHLCSVDLKCIPHLCFLLIAVKKLLLKKLVVHRSIPWVLRINILSQIFHLLAINLT